MFVFDTVNSPEAIFVKAFKKCLHQVGKCDAICLPHTSTCWFVQTSYYGYYN